MAFDSFDTVIHPDDDGKYLCVPCARRMGAERGWDDPEDGTGAHRPVFDLTEVDELPRCAMCGAAAEYCSFGPSAVDHGLGLLREHLRHPKAAQPDDLDYLDAYAEHLRWCNLGSGYEGARGEIIVRRFTELRRAASK